MEVNDILNFEERFEFPKEKKDTDNEICLHCKLSFLDPNPLIAIKKDTTEQVVAICSCQKECQSASEGTIYTAFHYENPEQITIENNTCPQKKYPDFILSAQDIIKNKPHHHEQN